MTKLKSIIKIYTDQFHHEFSEKQTCKEIELKSEQKGKKKSKLTGES